MGKNTRKNSKEKKRRTASSNRQRPSYPALELEAPEAVAARAILSRMYPARRRIESRANEARKFEQWRVNPSHPEPGSPLTRDDTDFFSEAITTYVTKGPVVSHALFPAMSAAENLTTAVRLIDDWDVNGKMRIMSVIAMCRSALESSSRTVWILSPTSSDERRDRALRMTKAEVLEQKKYLAKQVAAYEDSENTEHLATLSADLDSAKKILDELKSVAGVPNNETFIEQASEWVDQTAINPQHTPMKGMAKPLYSIASGITHGYSWTTRHLEDVSDMFAITSDFLYASTSMLSAGVILFETQASASDSISNRCPPHLRPIASSFHNRYATEPTTESTDQADSAHT
ncbi:hypothetical protein [Gordonia rubripertincta]|uniref:Uncharacterized protein n=1 Tax=Gordonia rubripertincta TaxID=36822 RepID=A0ABT4MTA1_GORRU|nr:hypothetical protein [Gordonia rubripertincta]MCZ4550244.1 hypothetical protein [Gordonia rubripertincta]